MAIIVQLSRQLAKVMKTSVFLRVLWCGFRVLVNVKYRVHGLQKYFDRKTDKQ
jgi:hypothetical protein